MIHQCRQGNKVVLDVEPDEPHIAAKQANQAVRECLMPWV
jgi:hypothetical protein